MKSEGQKQSVNQEKQLASILGGKRVSGSGSSWSHDADVDTEHFLVEAKWTAHRSFSIKEAVWHKISDEAWKIGKIPLLAVGMSSIVPGHSRRDLVVMDQSDFVWLVERAYQT